MAYFQPFWVSRWSILIRYFKIRDLVTNWHEAKSLRVMAMLHHCIPHVSPGIGDWSCLVVDCSQVQLFLTLLNLILFSRLHENVETAASGSAPLTVQVDLPDPLDRLFLDYRTPDCAVGGQGYHPSATSWILHLLLHFDLGIFRLILSAEALHCCGCLHLLAVPCRRSCHDRLSLFYHWSL